MGITEVFWLFLMLSALQPVIRQKLLTAARLRLLRRLEGKRGSLAIALIHRQETMSFLGFPLMRYIKSLGFPVSTAMPAEVYDFMRLFPQPTRTRPTVEYVPTPYRRGPDAGR